MLGGWRRGNGRDYEASFWGGKYCVAFFCAGFLSASMAFGLWLFARESLLFCCDVLALLLARFLESEGAALSSFGAWW